MNEQSSPNQFPENGAPARQRPIQSTHDLRLAERRLLDAMSAIWFGRFEFLQIRDGQLVLDPWPTTVRDVKFASTDQRSVQRSPEFELKRHAAEFFEYVRSVDIGEIRRLEVRHGLPFSMEIELHGPAAPRRTR